MNHGVQCSCPAGMKGNAHVACSKPLVRCDGNCPCYQASGYCTTRCSVNTDCACGETCLNGLCHAKCSASTPCPVVSTNLKYKYEYRGKVKM